MDVALISALMAASVSVLALVITKIVEMMENRKNRYASLITKQTIESMLHIRRNTATILSHTHPAIINLINEDEISKIKKELIASYINVEAHFKIILPMELEILNNMRHLITLFFKYCETFDDSFVQKIADQNKKLTEIVAPYDYSDWLYCKDQAWYRKKTYIDFEKIYCEQKQLFAQSNKPDDWETLMHEFEPESVV